MRSRFLYVLLFVAALVATGCAQPSAALPKKAPGKYDEAVTAGGLTRRYILRVPKAYDATKPLPLVILLHGWTSTAERMEQYTRFVDKAEKEGFFLATPQGLGERAGWNVGWMDLSFMGKDDVGFISKMLDEVESLVGVDKSRIYIAGHSNGAMLAHLVASKLSNRIAAIGAVAGSIGFPARPNFTEKTIPAPLSPVSVMLIHGTKDALVAYTNGAQAVLASIGARESAKWWAEKVGATTTPTVQTSGNITTETFASGKDGAEVVVVSIAEGTHDWPSNATDLIWDFLKTHPKK